VRIPSFAVTLLASWAVALVVELVLIWNDASFLMHVPFGEGAWSVPALGFVLELAYLQAALAPPASFVSVAWLLASARRSSPEVADALAARGQIALRGLGLGAIVGAWLGAGVLTAPWPAPWSWVAAGLTIAALVVLPLAVAFVLDAVAPMIVVEGVIEELLELRPRRGSPSYLMRIGAEVRSAPKRLWDAASRGERVRVVTYGFTGRFYRLETLRDGHDVTST
jgi:hypothetical protein